MANLFPLFVNPKILIIDYFADADYRLALRTKISIPYNSNNPEIQKKNVIS